MNQISFISKNYPCSPEAAVSTLYSGLLSPNCPGYWTYRFSDLSSSLKQIIQSKFDNYGSIGAHKIISASVSLSHYGQLHSYDLKAICGTSVSEFKKAVSQSRIVNLGTDYERNYITFGDACSLAIGAHPAKCPVDFLKARFDLYLNIVKAEAESIENSPLVRISREACIWGRRSEFIDACRTNKAVRSKRNISYLCDSGIARMMYATHLVKRMAA